MNQKRTLKSTMRLFIRRIVLAAIFLVAFHSCQPMLADTEVMFKLPINR